MTARSKYSSWPEVVRKEFDSGHGRTKRLVFIMNHASDPAMKLAAADAVLSAAEDDFQRRTAREE